MKQSEKFKNMAAFAMFTGIIGVAAVTLTIAWQITVIWLSLWFFGFAVAAISCAKDAEKNDK